MGILERFYSIHRIFVLLCWSVEGCLSRPAHTGCAQQISPVWEAFVCVSLSLLCVCICMYGMIIISYTLIFVSSYTRAFACLAGFWMHFVCMYGIVYARMNVQKATVAFQCANKRMYVRMHVKQYGGISLRE